MKQVIRRFLCAVLALTMLLCCGCMDSPSQTADTDPFTLKPLEDLGQLWELLPPAIDPDEYIQYPNEPPTEAEEEEHPADWLAAREALLALLYGDYGNSISVSHCYLPYTQETMDYFGYVFLEEPWFLRLCSDGRLTVEGSGGYITTLRRESADKAKEIEMYDQCMDAMSMLLGYLREDESLTLQEKLLILHDRLCMWVRYDQDNYEAHTLPASAICAYGPLVLRSASCLGYAHAMRWMAMQLGVDCSYQSSQNMGHSWNGVTLEGSTYFLDATHDDPIYTAPGFVGHDHFLVSSAKYTANHADSDPDWDMTFTDTRYDDAFWTRSYAQIVYLGGWFYFIDKETGDLIARSRSGEEIPILNTQQAFTDFGYYYSWASKMTSIGNEIFYTQPRSVCAYNPSTGEVRTVYTVPDSLFADDTEVIVGMDRVGGTMRVYLRNDMNDFATSDLEHRAEFTCCTHGNALPYTAMDGSQKMYCPDCSTVF